MDFKNTGTLVGKNKHRDGKVFNWILTRPEQKLVGNPAPTSADKVVEATKPARTGLLATDVVGRFFIYLAGSPQGGAPWEFTNDGVTIQNGRKVGTWKVTGEKLIITFSNEAAGTAVLEFKDRDTLAGKNEHKNGKVFHWEGRREKAEVARVDGKALQALNLVKTEKARLTREFGFDKIDYSKGPNCEKLEEKQENGWVSQGYVKDGKFVPHGTKSNKWPNGQIYHDLMVYGGKGHGVQVWWHDNGSLRAIFVMKDDARHGPWQEFHPNGGKKLVGNYTNGWKEGKWERWYDNGKMREANDYKKGKLHGDTEWYRPDGTKIDTYQFAEGRLLFDRSKKTTDEFLYVLAWGAHKYSSGVGKPFVTGVWSLDTFRESFGEPDLRRADGLSNRFPERFWTGRYSFKCVNGVVRFKVSIIPANNYMLLEAE